MPGNETKTMSNDAMIVQLEGFKSQLEELRKTIDKYNNDVHGHIDRKINSDVQNDLLLMRNEITKETDQKLSRQMDKFKELQKTIIMVFLFGITATVGTTAYFSKSGKDQVTVKEIGELYKLISQENRKNVKQTQVIIDPSNP